MRLISTCALAAALAAFTSAAQAATVLVGGFQGWDPPAGVVMTETGAGTNIFTASLTGIGAGRQEFKILDDQGDGANWGDPELSGSANDFFYADGAGNITITIDRNLFADGYAPDINRVSVSNDATSLFATGNFMVAAGGAGDWNPGDPSFAMTSLGGGDFVLTKTIATPGTYEYKATQGDWDGQWGTDGRSINGVTWLFTTTDPNQAVSFYASTSLDGIRVAVPEPTTLGLLGGLALTALRRRR